MAREIKFRAWHSVLNEMFPNVQNHINDKVWAFGSMLKDPERFIIEQYTGLKDNNGKEIYENDVLEYTVFDFTDNDTQFKGVVKWIGSGFIVTQIPDKLCNGDYGLELFWVSQQDCELEIIGNIHENKELLNK